MVINFAEKNYSKQMNTLFDCNAIKKWTWKTPNNKSNDAVSVIFTIKLSTVKNEAVLNKLKSSDHRMVKCKVRLY